MSDTPRTDAGAFPFPEGEGVCEVVYAEVARALERELAQQKADYEAYIEGIGAACASLRAELAEAVGRIVELSTEINRARDAVPDREELVGLTLPECINRLAAATSESNA